MLRRRHAIQYSGEIVEFFTSNETSYSISRLYTNVDVYTSSKISKSSKLCDT